MAFNTYSYNGFNFLLLFFASKNMGTIYAMIKSSIFFSANEIVCNQTNAFENLDQVLESGNVSTKNAFVLKLFLRCLFRIAVLNGAPNEKFEGSQKECQTAFF